MIRSTEKLPPCLLMVTHYFPRHGGGIEMVAGHLAKQYVERHGCDLVWFASDCDLPPEREKLRCCAARCWNAIERRFGIPYPLWSPGSLIALWRATRQSDVVHVHDTLYMGNLMACLFAALLKKPVILTQHIGLVPYRSRFLRGLHGLLNRTFGKWLLSRASQSVFVSEAVMHYFSAFTHFRRPPMVIANGLDTTRFRPADDDARTALRNALGLPPDRPLLLFVGRFVEKKGLPVLHTLAKNLQDCTWIFAGRGPLDPQTWNLPNVRVMHDVPQADLVPLYQCADLLVLPSQGEGFPLVVQEAMACGTPALVGPDSAGAFPMGPDLIFAEAVDGPDVTERWQMRINVMLHDPIALSAKRQQVADYARRTWSWKTCSDAYAQILRVLR